MIKKVLIVVGTRPNFIKITQFKTLASEYKNLEIKIVHTGQHYDDNMAGVFFEQFNLTPDYFLNISPNTPNKQMAEIMVKLEDLIKNTFAPNIIVVVGDVNSTLAAAITANKAGIKLAHIESGLRSFDTSMPEEHNRVLTDKITDIYFVTEQSGFDNLIKEGVNPDKIVFTGNTMIDTMVSFENKIIDNNILKDLNINPKEYILMTIHRPATVENKEELLKLIELVKEISVNHKIIFPIHPNTLNKIKKFELIHEFETINNLNFIPPQDYFSFQKLISSCFAIITDSGGIQEESTFKGIPCLTLRPNTERPITVTEGTNTLIPFNIDLILNYLKDIEKHQYKKGVIPKYWDGKSTERILNYLSKGF